MRQFTVRPKSWADISASKQVHGSSLQEGDWLIDDEGKQHRIVSVVKGKDGSVDVDCEDDYSDAFDSGESVTIADADD